MLTAAVDGAFIDLVFACSCLIDFSPQVGLTLIFFCDCYAIDYGIASIGVIFISVVVYQLSPSCRELIACAVELSCIFIKKCLLFIYVRFSLILAVWR